MFYLIKKRLGIAENVTVYDDDIRSYLSDCEQDMLDSGVPKKTVDEQDDRVVTAATLYVKANLGNDRTDTDRYMELYRQKVFRLTLDPEEDGVCGMAASY